MAKDTYYFQHDYNARSDKKTKALIKKHGAAGYGLYWILAEMLHEDENSGMELDEIQYEALSDESKLKTAAIKSIVDDCINIYGLFYLDEGLLKSNRVDRNKAKMVEIKGIKSKAGKASAEKRAKSNTCSTPVQHVSTGVEQNPTKETKEIKETNKQSNAAQHFLKVDGMAMQLMQHRPGLEIEQAKDEARKLLQKEPTAGTSFIAEWASRIRLKRKVAIMVSPFGQEVDWEMEQYERLKNTTNFKLKGYADRLAS